MPTAPPAPPTTRRRRRAGRLACASAVLTALATACGSSAPRPPTPSDGTLVAAVGDISPEGESAAPVATAQVAAAAQFILGLGDYQYPDGRMRDYDSYFDRSWGKNVAKMYPVLSPNHDQFWRDAAPLRYFNGGGASGAKAPVTLEPHRSYSFDRAGWHFLAIDDSCYRDTSACDPADLQAWVHDDLAAHPARCTIAYWHQPYWTSPTKEHDRLRALRPVVDELDRAGVDITLNGHQHGYERFRPQKADGQPDDATGIRSFVVGTGGIGFYDYTGTVPNSVTHQSDTYGVLMLTLRADGYSWRFLRAAGGTYGDEGSGSCH